MKKKFSVSAVFIIILFSSINAQITLLETLEEHIEHSSVILIYNTDFNGCYTKYTSNIINFYHEDLSLRKSVNISVPSGIKANISYVSGKIFNTDNKLEFIISFLDSKTAKYSMLLYDEDGNIIKDFGTYGYLSGDVCQTSNGDYRLIVRRGGSASTVHTDIYSLPGKGSEVAISNPKVKKVTDLAFDLRPGEIATMKIYNIKGQLIETKQVDYMFNKVLLNTTKYRKGVYVYEINGISKKFRVK